MIRLRHLVHDDEKRIDVSQGMILVALGGNCSAEMLGHEFQNGPSSD